jgi:hypothetical protein
LRHGSPAPESDEWESLASKLFSDGVIAIIITIMVLELKAPHRPSLEALQPVLPALLSYALSFLYVGIFWNNHHHLLQAADRVSGPILWANLHLLFWLSLIPFATSRMDDNHYSPAPTVLYGAVLLMAAVVRVNVLSPSPVNTPILGKLGVTESERPKFVDLMGAMIPAGRLGEAHELAQAALFLASDASSFRELHRA